MSSSPIRGNEPGDLSVALGPKTSSPMLQGVLFLILLHFHFKFSPSKPPLILANPIIQIKFTSFNLTVNDLYEENPSLYSTLDHYTAVA